MATFVALALLVAVLVMALQRRRRRQKRRQEEKSIATELVPEIRAIVAGCDSRESAEGAPLRATHYALLRQRLPRFLSEDTLFAVETFYQSVEAYRAASTEMGEAFAEGSGLSLGDKIRAKDRRDRCLKDVLYVGEAAVERLSKLD